MSASGWVGSLGFAFIAGLASSGHAVAQGGGDNASARAQMESQQSYRGGRGRGDVDNGRHDGGRNYDRHDRHDHWDRHNHRDRHWRGGGWGWGGPAVVWAPAPRYYGGYYGSYYGGSYRSNHISTFDAIVLGLFGTVVIDALSDNQRRRHETAYSSALSAPVGQNIIWNDNNSNGTIRVTRDGYSGNKYCREFQQTIRINSQQQEAWGISCQEPDGSWRIQPQN